MILWYKNSFLASVVSILGCFLVFAGIATFGDDAFVAVLLIVIGIAVAIWGKVISSNKAFKVWWKQVEMNNLEPAIAASVETAVAVYKKNPQKRTLKKITALNPEAGRVISASIAKK